MDYTIYFVIVTAVILGLSFVFRKGNNFIVYEDINGAQMLKDEEFRIEGKPDQILKNRRFVTVIEVKSKFIPNNQQSPYSGDRMQLAAYMKIAENHFGKVKGGYVSYKNRSFYVPWNWFLKRQLKRTLQQMEIAETGEQMKVKPQKQKCYACVYRDRICKIAK